MPPKRPAHTVPRLIIASSRSSSDGIAVPGGGGGGPFSATVAPSSEAQAAAVTQSPPRPSTAAPGRQARPLGPILEGSIDGLNHHLQQLPAAPAENPTKRFAYMDCAPPTHGPSDIANLYYYPSITELRVPGSSVAGSTVLAPTPSPRQQEQQGEEEVGRRSRSTLSPIHGRTASEAMGEFVDLGRRASASPPQRWPSSSSPAAGGGGADGGSRPQQQQQRQAVIEEPPSAAAATAVVGQRRWPSPFSRGPRRTSPSGRITTVGASAATTAAATGRLTTSSDVRAIATVDPGDFSMEAYRDLHQRQFASASEELFFLRRDFVSSRRTLAVLYDETARLKAELLNRARENEELREKTDWFRRQLDRLRGGRCATVAATHAAAAATWGHNRAAWEECASFTDAEGNIDGGSDGDDGEGDNDGKTRRPPAGLALYAAAGAAASRHRRRAAATAGAGGHADNEVNTVTLINELRGNLAARDSALGRARVDLGEMKMARDALEREARTAKAECAQALQDQHRTLASLNEKVAAMAALEETVRGLRETAAAAKAELGQLRRRSELASLLGDYPAAKAADDALSQHEYLFDQVKTYRERWQAAEDRIDELHKQILSSSSATAQGGGGAVHSVPGEGERLRLEDEVRSQLEAIRRLQRKLEREQEASAFHEEQGRQQRGADLRQHALETAALREQLQAARGQIASEAADRAALSRQLRQATYSESLTETLQQTSAALKQRLAEVTAEMAQVQGRERELEVSVQREIAERMRLARESEAQRAQVVNLERREELLNAAVADLRAKLGGSEARASVYGGDGGSPLASSSDTAAAMASELKGYTALMTLNATLQQKLDRAEGKLLAAVGTRKATGSSSGDDDHDNGQGLKDEAAASATAAAVAVAAADALREEVRQLKKSYRTLLSEQRALEKEHAAVIDDNALLAGGAEALHGQLTRLTAEHRRLLKKHQQQQQQQRDHRATSEGLENSTSRLRDRLERARQYAAPSETLGASSPARLLTDSLGYAGELEGALAAAQTQVAVLAAAIESLPGTPLKGCRPQGSSSGGERQDAANHVAALCCTPAGPGDQSTSPDVTQSYDGMTVTITHQDGECPAMAAAAGTPNSGTAALRERLWQTREERDHWRSLADRYTVACTSTIESH